MQQGTNTEAQEKARGRQKYLHEGREIYEWEQTLEEVNIYIKPPPYVLEKNREEVRKQLKPGQELPKLEVKIKSNHVTIGVKGNPPFIDQDLSKMCAADESFWMIEDEELHIQLQKVYKGEVWPCVFKGHDNLDPFVQEEVQKKLMLERFQQENPGFDFSQAQFNGTAPDPRTFMGGLKHN